MNETLEYEGYTFTRQELESLLEPTLAVLKGKPTSVTAEVRATAQAMPDGKRKAALRLIAQTLKQLTAI
jgi:hypothetical protein